MSIAHDYVVSPNERVNFDKIKIESLLLCQVLEDGWTRNSEITLCRLKFKINYKIIRE